MSKELIDEAVNRFLAWKLPQDFYPDSGIAFNAKLHDTWGGYPNSWPTGTNLFTAEQARAMFQHCLTAQPPAPVSHPKTETTLEANVHAGSVSQAAPKEQT